MIRRFPREWHVSQGMSNPYLETHQKLAHFQSHTRTQSQRLAPLFIVSLIPRSTLFSLSLFFSFLFFFSSFLCFFDVRKREHRGFPNTMRRNWKSPDAENWSFPMIREFIELDSRIVRISLPFLVNYNFKSESVTITLRIVYADSYLWEKWFKEVENLSRWNVEQCSQKTLRVPRDEVSTRRRRFMR